MPRIFDNIELELLPALRQTIEGDVGVALSLSLEALGAEEQRIRWEGSQAMAKGDYDTAEAVLDFAISDKGRAWLKRESSKC